VSVWRTGGEKEVEKGEIYEKKVEIERKPTRGIDVFLDASEFETSWKRD